VKKGESDSGEEEEDQYNDYVYSLDEEEKEEVSASESDEEEEQQINTSSRGPNSNGRNSIKKSGFNVTQSDSNKVEVVPYEANLELLRAFGQPVGATFPKSNHGLQGSQVQTIRETTYCFCNNVSYGDMIACDNKNCPYEWFHFPCVGLIAKPEGKWLC